jgi:hypothetical protein
MKLTAPVSLRTFRLRVHCEPAASWRGNLMAAPTPVIRRFFPDHTIRRLPRRGLGPLLAMNKKTGDGGQKMEAGSRFQLLDCIIIENQQPILITDHCSLLTAYRLTPSA